MKSLRRYQYNSSHINKKIYSNPVNSIKTISAIEKILIRERGNVFSMPPKGSPVIAFMSGGLDTTVVVAMLLEYFKLSVYPLHINRQLPHGHQVKKSIAFFSSYFTQRYPKLFHMPFEINQQIPPIEFASVLKAAENDITVRTYRKGIPLQPSVYANTAIYYAKYLEETTNIKPRTIFGGWLPSNSDWYAYESMTSLRSIMLTLCTVMNDYSWQFTSLPMEKELGFYFDKDALVSIGIDMSLPLEKTWTCYKGGTKHCGQCPPCSTRKTAFQKANILDNTPYFDGLTIAQRLRRYIKRLVFPIYSIKTRE